MSPYNPPYIPRPRTAPIRTHRRHARTARLKQRPMMPLMPSTLIAPAASAPEVHITYTGGTIGMVESPHGLIPGADLDSWLAELLEGTALAGRVSLTVLDPLIAPPTPPPSRGRRSSTTCARTAPQLQQTVPTASTAPTASRATSSSTAPTRWPTPRQRCPTP